MNILSHLGVFLFIVCSFSVGWSQEVIDTKNATIFSGSFGFTNNGFSIIPTFSLNSPAFVTNLSIRKNKFSFESDLRLVPNAEKGGLIWW